MFNMLGTDLLHVLEDLPVFRCRQEVMSHGTGESLDTISHLPDKVFLTCQQTQQCCLLVRRWLQNNRRMCIIGKDINDVWNIHKTVNETTKLKIVADLSCKDNQQISLSKMQNPKPKGTKIQRIYFCGSVQCPRYRSV